MILWSDDCLACLCNMPHSLEEHLQAVECASAELQEQLEMLRREHRLDSDFDEYDLDD